MSIFDSQIAAEVAQAFATEGLPVTVTRTTNLGSFDPTTSTMPAPVTAEYSGRGFMVGYSERWRLEGLVSSGDRKAILFQRSFPAAMGAIRKGDRLTIRGIVSIVDEFEEDAARATWIARCKVST